MTNEQRKPLKLNKLCETLRRRSATGSKKEARVTDVDEKLKQNSGEKKALASVEAAMTVKDGNAMPEKRAAKMSSCNSCFQKIFPNEGCLCLDYFNKDDSNEEARAHQSVEPLFPKEAYDLLAKLLTVDPEKRITADVALRHPFFLMDFPSS